MQPGLRIDQRVQHVQVVGAGHRFADRHRARPPGLVNQTVLAQELLALERAAGGVQRAARRGESGWAEPARQSSGQVQIGLQERRLADRLEVVDARHRQRALHQLRRQIGCDRLPIAAQQHARQVPAGRVAGHDNAPRVAAVQRRIAVSPGHRLHQLHDDCIDAHARAKRVIGQHHQRTGPCVDRRDERQVALVERAPPAAVNEKQHRRVGAGGGKDIQRLTRPGSVGHVEPSRRTLARQCGSAGPAVEDRRVLGNAGAVVVLLVQPRGFESGHAGSGGSMVVVMVLSCLPSRRHGAVLLHRAALAGGATGRRWATTPMRVRCAISPRSTACCQVVRWRAARAASRPIAQDRAAASEWHRSPSAVRRSMGSSRPPGLRRVARSTSRR